MRNNDLFTFIIIHGNELGRENHIVGILDCVEQRCYLLRYKARISAAYSRKLELHFRVFLYKLAEALHSLYQFL